MTRLDPMAGIPESTFRARRAAVFRALGRGLLVLPAAPLLYRSRDTEVPYRPDSELFYVTGATAPGTVAVLVGGSEPRFVLFQRERDAAAEVWTGPRLGPEEARERFGADEVHPRSELAVRLGALMRDAGTVHVRLGVHDEIDGLVLGALADARSRGARDGNGLRSVVDPGEILDDLRLVKDPVEIERLRAAAALSVEGHRAAAAILGPGVGEWEIQAAVDAVFRRGGGAGPGYGTIVGSGPNATYLHYVDNGRVVEAGDLVLVDAGAEVALYQGDITRAYPADGRFRGEQRAVYEVVDRARAEAVAAVSPGVSVAEVHGVAARVLAEGLVGLGVLEGDVAALVEADAHRPWFPHRTSHWLGLDVHDPGDYSRDGAPRVLEAGMVLTVEPGLYFPVGSEGGAARFAGIGVRVEDDVLVTPDGRENLTAALPTDAAEIEAMVRDRR